MEKTALNPKALTALKILKSAGALGGAGIAGGVIGHRRGVMRTADAMANEFSSQNALENQAIAENFNAFNQDENRRIASNAFMKGVEYAMSGEEMGKESAFDDYAAFGFAEEIEKIAGAPVSKIDDIMDIVKKVKNMAKGVGSKYQKSIKATMDLPARAKSYSSARSTYRKHKSNIPQMEQERARLESTLGESGLALGTAAGGAAAGGLLYKLLSKSKPKGIAGVWDKIKKGVKKNPVAGLAGGAGAGLVGHKFLTD